MVGELKKWWERWFGVVFGAENECSVGNRVKFGVSATVELGEGKLCLSTAVVRKSEIGGDEDRTSVNTIRTDIESSCTFVYCNQ